MVAGRIVSFSAAHLLPFAEVKPLVQASVVGAMAAAQARKDGEARLASLRQAPDSTLTEPDVTVSRAQRHDLPAVLIDTILRADASKLPAYVGVDLGAQGYAIAKLKKVLGRDPMAGDAKQIAMQYAQGWGGAEMSAYYDALKARFKVNIVAPPSPEAEAARSASAAAR
jgi:peptidyl-prolyl cis-trans isomerase D